MVSFVVLEKLGNSFKYNITKVDIAYTIVELSVDHFKVIIKYKDSLIKLGLVIEEFDNNAIVIREHSAILDKVNFLF